MQYTGVHDKNGKPIYEGDILGGCLEHGVVVWRQEEARWGIDLDGGRKEIHFWDVNQAHLDVIGTMYENLDLPK